MLSATKSSGLSPVRCSLVRTHVPLHDRFATVRAALGPLDRNTKPLAAPPITQSPALSGV